MAARLRPTYHVVSHSHWDREWYFTFDRFRAMLVDMIEDLLVLFRRDKGFRSYTLDGQMAAVLDYLEIRPERETVIRDLVKRRKLFVGPWYILNDEFLSSGESHIRNLLLGFRMGKQFGGVMKVGYIPDQFGHIAQMPQILRGFGIDVAMIYRGFGGEAGQEKSEYWWVSPDGSRVLMHHLPRDGYSAGYFGTTDPDVALKKFERLQKELDARATTSQRLFFDGGDHHWPDEAVSGAIKVLEKHYPDARFIHSNFVDYFSALRKELGKSPKLPALNGETRFGYRHAFSVLGGVFSSRMYLKQMNAAGEVLLERVLEPFNVFAAAKGMRSKTPQIEQAWKYVIQNQDHDAICGTSTDEVHREMAVRYTKARGIGAHVVKECLDHLLPYDEHEYRDERFLFLMNPSPFKRSDIVETSLDFFLQDIVVGLNPEVAVAAKLPPVKGFRLFDREGKEVPYQILKRGEEFGITYSKHDYPHQTLVDQISILVSGQDMPPLGWKGLRITRAETEASYPSFVHVGENFIENEFLRLDARPDGSITMLQKETGAVYAGLNVFEDSGDVGDEYNYSYPGRDAIILSSQSPPSVRVLESGPLRASLQIDSVMNVPLSASADEKSRSAEKAGLNVSTVVFLTANSRRVDVRTRLRNTVKDHRFRVQFPTGIDSRESYAETPFAVVRREHREYDVSQFPYEHPALVAPMQRFVTVMDAQKGFTLITRGLPEYELSVKNPGLLSLTLLRCVGKLSGRDLITRPGGAAGWWTETPDAQCQGDHEFEYALFAHGGSNSDSWPAILREVESFTVRPFGVKRKNDQPVLQSSFLSMESDGLQLSGVKESEDRKGVVVRVCNPVDRTATGHLRFDLPVRSAFLCRLNEKVIRPLQVRKSKEIGLSLQPFAIMTLKFSFKANKSSLRRGT